MKMLEHATEIGIESPRKSDSQRVMSFSASCQVYKIRSCIIKLIAQLQLETFYQIL